LRNVVKHAAATEVWIRMATSADGLTLSIEDDGKGFESKADAGTEGIGSPGRARQGNGLRNMRKRAEDIGGKFDLSSQPGRGTQIRVELGFHQK